MPLVALDDGAVLNTSWLADPMATVIGSLTTEVTDGKLKVRVKDPAVPLMVKPLKVATPLLRVAVAPVRVPVPEVIVAVTVPVAVVTVLSEPSTTRTTGCVVSATPLVAVLGGPVVNSSLTAAPGFKVITLVIGLVIPGVANDSV